MELVVKIYDVEHGSCSHIITPNNKHILIDIGSKSDKSIVGHIKNKYFLGNRVHRIDKLFITHPHEDHIYDLPSLYNNLSPNVIHRPLGAFDIQPTQDTFLHKTIAKYANQMNKEYTYPVRYENDVDRPEVNGGATFTTFMPKEEWTNKDDLNTFSSIIVLEYMGYKFVFTGDNPKSILDSMIDENYENIKNCISNTTFLLAPHHGRTKEFSEKFFKCANPYLTLVSDKSIVHSTQEDTAQLYKGRGIEFGDVNRFVVTTRKDGTITIKINENGCSISMSKEEY